MSYAVSVVIPAYNEAENIRTVIGDCAERLRKLGQFEIIVVNDGSRDDTATVLEGSRKKFPQLKIVTHPQNRGYGAALKSGFYAAQYDYVVLIAGDAQFAAEEIDMLLAEAEQHKEFHIVAGFRRKRQDPMHRKINEFLYNSLIRVLFRLQLRDIDCGFKLYRREVFQRLPDLKSNGALIDAELLIKADKLGMKTMQVPVTHLPRVFGQQSGANLRVILKMFRELFGLWRELA